MSYFSELREYLKLEPSIQDRVISEINTHVEDKSQELIDAGLDAEKARQEAIKALGPARILANQIYEVYAQGSWKQAICAALPHLLIAALFALHLLPSVIWLVLLIILSAITVLYGWFHGKPDWLFPWLGVLISPAIITGLALIYLPSGWMWFAALTYIPLVAFVLFMVTKQTLKKDWLFISLMLMPVPLVLGWIFAFCLGTEYFDTNQIYEYGLWIALTFLILALNVIIFVRARKRWQKIWTLIVLEMLVIAIIILTSRSSVSFWGWAILFILTIGLIFGPAILEKRLKAKKYN